MDLSTTYMGIELRTPLVAGAGPFSQTLDGVRRLEDAGASAVVLYSLFEEQLTLDHGRLVDFLSQGSTYAETLAHFGGTRRMKMTPLDYLEAVNAASAAVDIPIIASLNGTPHLRWTHYARLLEQAGASGLELNFYYVPTDEQLTSTELEHRFVEALESVKSQVSIPVSLKLSPFFTNMAAAASAFVDAGADGLVMFNRFYQPDIDVESMRVRPHLNPSTPHDIRLPLRWISILRGRLHTSLIATGGVHSAEDALKLLMVGADATQLCSALLRHGVEHIRTIESGLRIWLSAHDFASVSAVKGKLSQANCPDPSAFERAQYMKSLESYHPEM